MQKLDFNKGWVCRCLTRDVPRQIVDLPHDAMLSEPRTEDSVSEGNIGWYIGGDYEYIRRFVPGAEMQGQKLLLEFEGVYKDAEVYVNGELAATRAYGYSNFYVDLTDRVRIGAENEIRVVAHNSEHPNSRWYSGTGIYRPVTLWHGEETGYIPVNGVRIRTMELSPAKIQVEVKTSAPGEVTVQILRNGQTVAEQQAVSGSTAPYTPVPAVMGRSAKTVSPAQECNYAAGMEIGIPDAALWSPEHPNLYTCRVCFGGDETEEVFGIRTLRWNPEEGMTLNGERVILRGACIHHDNGMLGAATYQDAEDRRVRLLKENGYNAIRSAHNPCSKQLLKACDEQGMLMMDEFADCWYIHKTRHDYVEHLSEWWQDDLREMVEKDYNHPCVIMYSTGNEVAETSQPKGIAFTKEMTDYLHRLDDTRPVTCGINIFFNYLFSLGMGVYSDEKADAAAQKAESPKKKQKKKHVGSDFYNTLALKVGDNFMKTGATLHGSNVKTRDAYASMDIAGYNYGLFRYRGDLKRYPTRLILGSETFCKDAYSFYEIAKKEKRIIGDFVWSGFDYIGECGEGAPEYPDYNFGLEEPATAMTGSGGRIDLTGKPKAEAAYTRVALEQETGPYISVEPVYQKDKIQISGWQLTKGLESWSWNGCDGNPAKVLVFARGAEAELLINGRSVGRKKLKKARAAFKTTYATGEVTAVSYDKNGAEIGRYTLKTAGQETELRAKPERSKVRPEGLIFVPIQYTDREGIWKPMEKHRVRVTVEGGKLLGLGNACPFYRGNYTDEETETYYGDALAVVQAGMQGTVRITVRDEENTVTEEVPIQA